MQGITHFLENTHDEEIMNNFIKRLSGKELFIIFNLLEFSDEEARKRWVNVYNNLLKNA
jgi:phosphopentomutase